MNVETIVYLPIPLLGRIRCLRVLPLKAIHSLSFMFFSRKLNCVSEVPEKQFEHKHFNGSVSLDPNEWKPLSFQ